MNAVLSQPEEAFRRSRSMLRAASTRFRRVSRSRTSRIFPRRISLQLMRSSRSISCFILSATRNVTRGTDSILYIQYINMARSASKREGKRERCWESAAPVRVLRFGPRHRVLLDEEVHVVHRAVLVDVLRVVFDRNPFVGLRRPVLVRIRHALRTERVVDLFHDAIRVRVGPLGVEAQVRGLLRYAVLVLIEDLGAAGREGDELRVTI